MRILNLLGKFQVGSETHQYVFGSPRGGKLRAGVVFMIEDFYENKSQDKKMKLIQRLSGTELSYILRLVDHRAS